MHILPTPHVSQIITPHTSHTLPGGCSNPHSDSYTKEYTIDVNTSRTPEERAHSPSWPNGLIIINIIRARTDSPPRYGLWCR
jgi:hypothetical protein